jgi:hypothetical protein
MENGAVLQGKADPKDLASRITQLGHELVYLLKQDQDSFEKIKHYQAYSSKLQEMLKRAEESEKKALEQISGNH